MGRCSAVHGLSTFWKPAFSRRNAALCTAWKGVGDAFTNLRNLVAASGLVGKSIMVKIREDLRSSRSNTDRSTSIYSNHVNNYIT